MSTARRLPLAAVLTALALVVLSACSLFSYTPTELPSPPATPAPSPSGSANTRAAMPPIAGSSATTPPSRSHRRRSMRWASRKWPS